MSTSGQAETDTAQKTKFSIKDFFMRIWSHLLKKSLMKNFIFLCSGVQPIQDQYSIFGIPILTWNGLIKMFMSNIFHALSKYIGNV